MFHVKRLLGVAGVALLLAVLGPATAQAHTTIIEPEGSRYPYQRWVDEAKVPTPDVTLALVEGPCPRFTDAVVACTQAREATIWLNVAAMRQGDFWPREIFYHELGHDFDYYDLSSSDRHRFRRLRHSTRPWKTRSPAQEGLQEKFAETYMSCAFDLPGFFRETQAEYSAKACRLIVGAA